VQRISYAWALAAAACLAAAVELVAPVMPGLLLTALLTLLVAQVPVPPPRSPQPPLTRRPRRSELDRHLERRVRRSED
jgi:hypothetical protein